MAGTTIDKNSAIITWLSNCDEIKKENMFFNYVNAENDGQGFTCTNAETQIEDVSGFIEGTYSIGIVVYKSIEEMSVKYNDGDIKNYSDVRKINEWIKAQNELGNFPVWESDYKITKVEALPTPTLAGVDNSNSQPLAKYILQIVFYFEKGE